jgi:hypothetical protein
VTRAGSAGRGRALLVLLVLAGVTALVHVPTWLTATGTSALLGEVTVAASGRQVAPAGLASAVVLLAAAAALGLVGRIGRWVVAVVVASAGVLVTASALAVLRDPVEAVRPAAVDATGVGSLVGPVAASAWPAVAVGVGVLGVVVAAWLVRAGRSWVGPSRRYESSSGGAAPVDDERTAWDALSRGDDPT